MVLKIAVRHHSKDALQIFAREIYPAATAMAQGLTGFAGGRPEPQPVIAAVLFLADKADVPVSVVDRRQVGHRSTAHSCRTGPPNEPQLDPRLRGLAGCETTGTGRTACR